MDYKAVWTIDLICIFSKAYMQIIYYSGETITFKWLIVRKKNVMLPLNERHTWDFTVHLFKIQQIKKILLFLFCSITLYPFYISPQIVYLYIWHKLTLFLDKKKNKHHQDSYFPIADERGYHKWALAHSSSCLIFAFF
jgi:hypothetical protein